MIDHRPSNSFTCRWLRPFAFAALLLALLGTTGCWGASRSNDALIYGRGSETDTLDPINSNSGETAKVLVNIYDTLVTYADDSMEIVPSLAKSWESSDDGLTWTFHLRDDVKFHDGSPFNADAAIFSFQRTLDPETNTLLARRCPTCRTSKTSRVCARSMTTPSSSRFTRPRRCSWKTWPCSRPASSRPPR